MWWKYPFTRGKTVFVRCFRFQHSVMANPAIFWTLLRSNAYAFVKDFVFSCQGKSREIVYQRICLFLWLNIRPARTFWNSTHCLVSPFTLDWSQNLWRNTMWNMAVNNISYHIYPLSTKTEKGYITKMIPFFFCSVYFVYYRVVHRVPAPVQTAPIMGRTTCILYIIGWNIEYQHRSKQRLSWDVLHVFCVL